LNEPNRTYAQVAVRFGSATSGEMILLLALAAVAAPQAAPDPGRPSPSAAVAASASATVRILHSATASSKDWSRPAGGQKREVLVREADGRVTRLRLIEHE